MKDEQKFIRDVQRTLEAGNERLSPALRSEIARRRRLALDAAQRPRRQWLWLPAGAAAAAVLAVMVARPWGGTALPGTEDIESDVDMEIVMAGESLEMVEDLEFFLWLAERGESG